jgi:EPS-associated MarR family transcriptional regulator
MEDKTEKKLADEASLHLLREISANPRLTQRDMSSRLNMSLGKINFLIRAMIEKGILKVENFRNSDNKTAYLYLLTPVGVEQKAKITLDFLRIKTEEYKKLKDEIVRLETEAQAIDSISDSRNKFSAT